MSQYDWDFYQSSNPKQDGAWLMYIYITNSSIRVRYNVINEPNKHPYCILRIKPESAALGFVSLNCHTVLYNRLFDYHDFKIKVTKEHTPLEKRTIKFI